jgi:predicted transcriptional regulator of viral defense system
LELIPALNQEKLIHYLNRYQIQSLHQKTGLIMSYLNTNLNFKKSFFDNLKRKLKQCVTYLDHQVKTDGIFNQEFQIVIPKWLKHR